MFSTFLTGKSTGKWPLGRPSQVNIINEITGWQKICYSIRRNFMILDSFQYVFSTFLTGTSTGNLNLKGMKMGSVKGSKIKNFIVSTVHLI